MINYNDIKTPEQLYLYMKNNIKYGFISSYDKKEYIRDELKNDQLYEKLLHETYYLQSPQQLLLTKCGLCYDQVEFARNWLELHGYKTYTYFSFYHNHATLIYEDNEIYSLFERTLPKGKNKIYRAKTLEDCLNIYVNIQLKDVKGIDELEIYLYDKPEYGLNFEQFRNYASSRKEKKIILNKL